jgi:hypothetical protein
MTGGNQQVLPSNAGYISYQCMIWVLGGKIGTANSHLIGRWDANLLKILIAINFVMLLVMISPAGTSHEFYKAHRESAPVNAVLASIQVSVVTSTIIATALFALMLWKTHRAALPVRSVQFEGILLLAWWLTLLALCAYAYVMGMGG